MAIGDAVRRYLARAGLAPRLDQVRVIEHWAELMGPRIAQVATPESIAGDGTLFVRVTTAAWMQELQLQTPMVLGRLRDAGGKISRIVWKNG